MIKRSVYFAIIASLILPVFSQDSIDPQPNPSHPDPILNNQIKIDDNAKNTETKQPSSVEPQGGGAGRNAQAEARTAKYKAEQERIREIRRRQQELEEKRKREMGEPVEYQNDRVNLTKTREAQKSEIMKSREEMKKYEKEIEGIHNQWGGHFLFQTINPVEEFSFVMPDDMLFGMRMIIYTERSGAYGFVKDVETAKSLKVYIYEDNMRIVSQGEFYFELTTSFQVKKGSTYTVRFYNEGILKLVNINHSKLFSVVEAQNLIKQSHGKEHYIKGQQITSKVMNALHNLRMSEGLDMISSRSLEGAMMKFSFFQYGQMVAVLAITVLQVQLIKRMLNSQGIL